MKDEHPDKDWENRALCSDGNCIGVIGTNGLCKECGKPYDGPQVEGRVFEEDTPDEEDEVIEDGQEEIAEDPGWEDRQLCSDGNCIGVIGPDGRCKECGKPLDG